MLQYSELAPVIAVCGIDGSGKTSLVECLRRDDRLTGAAFVKKEQKEDFQRLLRLSPPTEAVPEAYFRGYFAEAARWAHALDFLRFYENVVAPIGKTCPVIVSDRWTFCTITFAEIGTNLALQIEWLLRNVPLPALTVYLDIDPEIALQRLLSRGALAHDEDLELLRAYRDAYRKYFATYKGPLLSLSPAPVEMIYSQVVKELALRKLLNPARVSAS